MPVEIMGDSEKMAAFRTRQAQSPEAVPTDIERQNELSKHRNRYTHLDDDQSGETAVPDPVRRVLSTPGQSLDTAVQSDLAERLGDRFDDVTIHTGPEAARACESVDARAFTVGSHVVFNHGEFDPDSATGKYLLAHELVHTRQQTDGRVTRLPADNQLEVRDSSSAYEREADEFASEALRSDAGVGSLTPSQAALSVQRMHKHELLEVLDDELEEDLPEEFEDGLPEEVLEKLPEALREGYENGHPAFTRAYERTFDNATFPELTREAVRNNERYGGEGSAHWTWEEIQNSLLFNDREGIENLSEREQRTLALFMNESDEIAAQFGEAIERHWQGLSGGEYLAASMENATAGAIVDISTGQPFVSTAAGVFSGPIRAQVEYQVDKRLPKDYDEYNKIELINDTFRSITEDGVSYTRGKEEEHGLEANETSFDDSEFGEEMQAEHIDRLNNEASLLNREQIEENLEELSMITSEGWVEMRQDQREEYLKTLQQTGLMSRVLVGTMASVDPDTIDDISVTDYAKTGASSAGVTGTTSTGSKASADAIESNSIDLSASVTTGLTKGGLKGVATVLTKLGLEESGTRGQLTAVGDALEDRLAKRVKGIRRERASELDSSQEYDELVHALLHVLDEEGLLEEHYHG
ncbi:hypothetical protein B1756_13810 [Natrarchaeobaculum aegyptiacum]|uniref:eCIS core domain-containing protein n=2 Tax=Natrarchaeobaculum aegyptiacum TaxID=745377 RepID=A0A2Z2HU10_9EURY|nr:hypothetical protein B1756_13810 [Natrarchaeobaculum aegyptiacum]